MPTGLLLRLISQAANHRDTFGKLLTPLMWEGWDGGNWVFGQVTTHYTSPGFRPRNSSSRLRPLGRLCAGVADFVTPTMFVFVACAVTARYRTTYWARQPIGSHCFLPFHAPTSLTNYLTLTGITNLGNGFLGEIATINFIFLPPFALSLSKGER